MKSFTVTSTMKKILLPVLLFVAWQAPAQTKVPTDTIQVKIPTNDWSNPSLVLPNGKIDCDRFEGFVVVDGRQFPCDSLQFLKPGPITELQVLGVNEALQRYGATAFGKQALVFTTNRSAIKRNQPDAEPNEIKKP